MTPQERHQAKIAAAEKLLADLQSGYLCEWFQVTAPDETRAYNQDQIDKAKQGLTRQTLEGIPGERWSYEYDPWAGPGEETVLYTEYEEQGPTGPDDEYIFDGMQAENDLGVFVTYEGTMTTIGSQGLRYTDQLGVQLQLGPEYTNRLARAFQAAEDLGIVEPE
jgi:hypothetical protein